MKYITSILSIVLTGAAVANEQPIPKIGETVEDFINRYSAWDAGVEFDDRAVFEMLEVNELVTASMGDISRLTENPDNPGWDATVQFLSDHPEVVDQISDYVELPHLGVPAEFLMMELPSNDSWLEATANDILSPHLVYVRYHSILLTAHAKLSLLNGDIDEAIDTLYVLRELQTKIAIVNRRVEYLVEFACSTMGMLTFFYGDFDLKTLNRDQLLRLQELYIETATGITADKVIDYEAWSIETFIDYVYRGAIAGNLPSRGYDRLRNHVDRHGPLPYSSILDGVTKSRAKKALKSRDDQMELLSEFVEAVRADFLSPESELESFQHESIIRANIGESQELELAYAPFLLNTSDFEFLYTSRYMHRSFRSSAALLIAIHLHHLEHGVFPQDVDGIDPQFIDEFPVDYLTGDRLTFRVEDGHVLIYSFGWDRDDDNGRKIEGSSFDDGRLDFMTLEELQSLSPSQQEQHDGDLILYPLSTE
ncbi:MAG: hypothetical protein ACSHX5_00165 [Phycisphaerales bacterium]